ncbi:MAG: hypothetical protein NTX50_03405, partial [Candidatus Sumerlaeota bacterium]|nr:hypothetical protein [Candidatus Sumerlaeota bacterium]
MKTMNRWIGLAGALILAAMAAAPVMAQTDAPPIVGRVYYAEGELLRYVPETKDWVAVVMDAPFGTEDTLFAGAQGVAELVIPNDTWIRMGNNTQIQFLALRDDLTEVDMASGMARFYNKSDNDVIKATCDFGYVLAPAGGAFDFYVGQNSAEVVPVRGTMTFVHSGTQARYELTAGMPSILADQRQVSNGEGTVDQDWDRWNAAREDFWAQRASARSQSAEYLPPTLQAESYVLDQQGQWDTVNYEGRECRFWRPVRVEADWAPFTVGRWTEWGGDQTWVPAESFGYMTHHYGNWVMVERRWYWAPPVARVQVGLPFLDIGFSWCPGRVSWIHSEGYVGWVPLAPREIYYSHHRWGGHHSEIINININININIGHHAYLDHAVIVHRDHFYGVNNYRNVHVTNINHTTIINNYHAAPVINNTVINNYTVNNQRYNFTNVTVNEKPHNTVINRIQQNTTIIQTAKHENAAAVKEQVVKIQPGKIGAGTRIEQPKITSPMVPTGEVNRPRTEIKLPQKEVKGRTEKPIDVTSGIGIRPPQGGKPGQPGQPTIPGQPTVPSTRPTVPSTRPTEPGTRPTVPSTRPTEPGARPTVPST